MDIIEIIHIKKSLGGEYQILTPFFPYKNFRDYFKDYISDIFFIQAGIEELL